MVSVLDSGSSCPGSRPSQDTALCSWERHVTLIVTCDQAVFLLTRGRGKNIYGIGGIIAGYSHSVSLHSAVRH